MKSLLLRILFGAIALGFVATSGFAQTHAGAIKAMKVSGTVSRVDSAGATSAVTDGTLLTEADTVVTGDNSGVVLVFMNGSSVKLGAKSSLLVEQFKMDPLATDINVATLKAEPSVSQTKLNLAYGEIVGDVKKLNKSSTYNIKTPVGAAGIRGTIFRILFLPAANGQPALFQLSTAEGLVLYTAPTGATTDVGQGSEVVATADVNVATGAIGTVTVQSQGISAEASAAIQTAVTNAIQQAQQAGVSFTPSEQQSAGSGSGTGTGGTGGAGGQSGGDAANSGEAAGAQGASGTPSGSRSTTGGSSSTFTPPTTGGTGGTTVDSEGKPVIDGSPSN